MHEVSADSLVLAGGGECGERMRAIDWAKTPLGPVSSWPQSLKTCVRIILTSRQPMFVWWGDRLINLYNDAYQSIVGGKHPVALGQPASVVWREIWNEVGPRAEKAMRENEGTYDEALLLVMERNGYQEETYYTFSYSPVPNDSGGTGGLICANTDDTQRIIGERQLTLLRQLAAETAEARTFEQACTSSARALATDPKDLPFALVYLAGADGRTLSLEGSTGMRVGHPLAPASLRMDGAGEVWPLAEAMRSGAPIQVDLAGHGDLPRGDWPKAPHAAAVIPIAGGGKGGRAGALVVGLNPYRLFDGGYRAFLELVAGQIAASVANAQAYEEERKRAEALAEIDRAKTAFFSNVSHEFRTPLTLMLGPTEDLLSGVHGELSSAQRHELELVLRNAVRLQKLVNTLLDFSRIEAGRVDASFRRTDLGKLTTDLASVFRSAVEKAGLRFVVDVAPVEAFVDRAMWEKIVFNLLSNALKFTFEGEIHVGLRQSGESIVLEVRDTGVGVPSEELPRLFDRFHRVHGARSRSHEGSGIGLALVQELAKLHGGGVAVESAVDVGSRFQVTIPIGAAHLPKDRLDAEQSLAPTSPRTDAFLEEATRWVGDTVNAASPATREGGQRAEVVLADDNTDMREYLRSLLAAHYDVRAFANGRAALESIRARRPALVLTDVMMPELDGFGLLRAIREERSLANLPVIMLSARAGEEAKVEGLEAGADDYLVKPFSAKELLARVATQIELARVRGEAEAERAKLHGLFMSAPALIALLRGKDHVFELANQPYVQRVGNRELLGRPIREAMPDLAGQGFFELLDEVFDTNTPRLGHERSVVLTNPETGESQEHFVNFVYSPYANAEGEVVGVAVYGFDVTDHVLARRQAEEAIRSRDDFLSVASHELRTPITSLSLNAQLIAKALQKLPDASRAMDKLRSMEVQIRRLAALVSGLLDVSRIASGRLELSYEPIDFATVVREVVERHAEQARHAGSEIRVEATPGLGHWDPLRLDQIATNLITNAVKYGNRRPIEVRAFVHDGLAHLEVHDQGIGIAPDDLQRLYGRFERFVPSKNYSGLGLGLWIVRNIVDAMGGTIQVRSELGRGTTFVVEIPERAPASVSGD